MSSAPHVVLHGGFHKTATSHIQSVLARNSGMLERAGVHYVHHRDTRKRLTVPVQCNAYEKLGMDWDPKIPDAELAEMTGAFFDEVLGTGAERVILSDENMAGHCGHCVKRGVIYRWRRMLIEVFAAQFPVPVREVHLGGAQLRRFLRLGLCRVPALGLGAGLRRRTPDAPAGDRQHAELAQHPEIGRHPLSAGRVTVWKYEDFRRIDRTVLANLCGGAVEVDRLKPPKDTNKRPTASGRAVAELLQLIHRDGAAAGAGSAGGAAGTLSAGGRACGLRSMDGGGARAPDAHLRTRPRRDRGQSRHHRCRRR